MNENIGKPDRYPEVGDLAPNFSLDSVGGRQVSLSDYLGRKIVIYMWASW